MDMGASWARMQRYAFVSFTMTVPLALTVGWSQQQSVFSNTPPGESMLTQPIVTSTPIEKALDELRARFPNSVVISFEELSEPRPDKEPKVDLGPTGSSLDQVLNRVRSIDPKYHVEQLQGRLVHVYPVRQTADPVGLLDIRLGQFSMPQDSCLRQAIENIDARGYAPELSEFLAKRKRVWYSDHGLQVPGGVLDILGNCFSHGTWSRVSQPYGARGAESDGQAQPAGEPR
jgi:hypothetical protein